MQRRGNAAVLTWPTSKKGETMKALVFGGPGQRSWDTADDPGIQDPTDVIVKVDTTTICGTDLHILKGDVPAVTEGRILGHEAVGTVVETGAAVSSLKEGDRVLVPAITSCGRSFPCTSHGSHRSSSRFAIAATRTSSSGSRVSRLRSRRRNPI